MNWASLGPKQEALRAKRSAVMAHVQAKWRWRCYESMVIAMNWRCFTWSFAFGNTKKSHPQLADAQFHLEWYELNKADHPRIGQRSNSDSATMFCCVVCPTNPDKCTWCKYNMNRFDIDPKYWFINYK